MNNRVVQIDHPSPLGSEYFEYDVMGTLVGKKDGEGIVTAYEYDEQNRLEKVDYDHGSWPIGTITADVTCTYAYDSAGRLTVSKTSDVGTGEYLYDRENRLTSYTPPAPSGHAAITYEYNALGQKISMTNGANVVEYEYYANGWLKRVTNGTTPYAEYAYDEVGNRTNVVLGNNATTDYGYDTDPRYRVSSITHTPYGGTPVVINYSTRDGAGNPTAIDGVAYGYDANSRLASVNSVPSYYDWVGNRNPSTWTYNDADQLEATPDHSFEYIGNGNLDVQKDEWGNNEKVYGYTGANLLAGVTHDDWSSAEKVDTKCIIDGEVFKNGKAIHGRVSGRGSAACIGEQAESSTGCS